MLTSSISKYEYYSERHGTTRAVEGILPIGGPQKLVPRRESKDFSLYKQNDGSSGPIILLYRAACTREIVARLQVANTIPVEQQQQQQTRPSYKSCSIGLFCFVIAVTGWDGDGRRSKRAGGRADGLIRRLPAAHEDRGGGRD